MRHKLPLQPGSDQRPFYIPVLQKVILSFHTLQPHRAESDFMSDSVFTKTEQSEVIMCGALEEGIAELGAGHHRRQGMREAWTSGRHRNHSMQHQAESQHSQRRGNPQQAELRACSPGLSHTAKQRQTHTHWETQCSQALGESVQPGTVAARQLLSLTHLRCTDFQSRATETRTGKRYSHKCSRATCTSLDRQNVSIGLI